VEDAGNEFDCLCFSITYGIDDTDSRSLSEREDRLEDFWELLSIRRFQDIPY